MSPGDRVRQARESADLGLRELARRLAISHSDLSAIEHGRRSAWPALRARLATELGASEAELFGPEPGAPDPAQGAAAIAVLATARALVDVDEGEPA